MATAGPASSFSFSLSNWNPVSKLFTPRLGSLLLHRQPQSDGTGSSTRLETPTFITTTSRGVVPHLSRDNVKRCESIHWVNVPFESFMESNPPIPTLYPGADPLHAFLGFKQGHQFVSMSPRNPYDGRQMPPNGKDTISVWTLQGVRKLTPADWRAYTTKCRPDVVFALSDTPFTDPPYSQKRLTKSIERSAQWLLTLLSLSSPKQPSSKSASKVQQPSEVPSGKVQLSSETSSPSVPPPVIVHLSGLSSSAARRAFSNSLLEPLYGPELDVVSHLGIKCLDEGVVGYSVDLVPIRMALEAESRKNTGASASTPVFDDSQHVPIPTHTPSIIPLVRSSLEPLPSSKLRVINGIESPHEILRYITDVGIDIFDAGWAQKCASVGVGLDFEFPVASLQETKAEGKRKLGHNLYDDGYQMDFGPLSSPLSSSTSPSRTHCQCPTCSPLHASEDEIKHGVDSVEYTSISTSSTDSNVDEPKAGYTRAYLHHLLHTHEMSAHTLLTMHNLEVLDRFFRGVRAVLALRQDETTTGIDPASAQEDAASRWDQEVRRFFDTYDEAASFEVFEEAKGMWRDVDQKRGKGRLAREKVVEGEGDNVL